MKSNLLEIENLKKYFPVTGGIFKRKIGDVRAVDGVSLGVLKGQTLGVVGESGCGKTTLGRTVAGLYKPTAGSIRFDNTDIATLSPKAFRVFRRDLQVIFQDPFESLNSRHSVRDILAEPFEIQTRMKHPEITRRIEKLLDITGLPKSAVGKFPHEFSGGQRQRIGIARAIALNPRLVICDEPVSALDVSIQSQIINLLMDLQDELGLTYFFIAHDLAVVKHISNTIAVMYLGKIVETAEADSLYSHAAHPYTKALISAIPSPEAALAGDDDMKQERILLTGDVPSPANPPPGCRFHTRCPIAEDICRIEEPVLKNVSTENDKDSEHCAACHLI